MAVWSVDARLEGGNNSAAHRKEKGRGLYEIPVVHTQSKELIGVGGGGSSYKLNGSGKPSVPR